MEKAVEDTMMFVLLVEEFKVILRNAQNPLVKKEKEVAVNAAVDKWNTISGKKLTPDALLKKFSNLKVRTKSAAKKGHQLTDWQTKILELTSELSKVYRLYAEFKYLFNIKFFTKMLQTKDVIDASAINGASTGDDPENTQAAEEPILNRVTISLF